MQHWQQELDALYILGDFFDYWVGDDDDNTFIRDIKQVFINFTQHKPIYFIGGNHDFGVGKRFARETGIQLLKDCSTLNIAGNKILLSHGDRFCTLDIKYQRLKKILQNPCLIFILRRLPLTLRYKIKEKLEHKASRAFNTQPQEIYHVVESTIVELAHKYQANIVIHGHTHTPNRYEITSPHGLIQRFEIPDWVDRKAGGYILLENEQIKLHIPH
jgi:UDP-2,3-diacylglucosamine hydrolase